jgi:nucleotide-binding universal stress UspA family protein
MIQTKEKVESMGVNCTAEFVKVVKGYDTIASGVIAYSNKAEADLIMIMTQQERDPVKFFIGSSAQTIISDSDVPVMSILPE